ncbi:3-phosphoshikimate 1-carboxyvinyltransferase [Peptococcus niger]|uniref:3-phosphoshikimate 1-carboxyvinyltransferase n=1 Tax=Peptococcus niger TaxID=2741 RepID=A0A1G6WGZ5_PEPNI|nr:3-phosphoshikimate 1-carboxyvinyltransferase [Peptococcus niger]SDD64983.1 3-phosphoshikimate 1-carboxyvinyltransferase [Peptococcus niger]
MDICIEPGALGGHVAAMPSKSILHRQLFCAALADGPTRFICPILSEDMHASLSVLSALGAEWKRTDTGLSLAPISHPPKALRLNAGESGTTLRFLLPLVAALGLSAEIDGEGRLPDRPLKALTDALRAGGVAVSADALPLSMSGRFQGSQVTLPGNVSSQYISAFLLAAPLLPAGLSIQVDGPLESEAYVAMTMAVMAEYGVHVQESGDSYTVAAGARYRAPQEPVLIEGDWSNAAFFLAAGAVGKAVTVTGLNPDSCQGDAAILPILTAFGARVSSTADAVTVVPGRLAGISLDVSQIPDLLPILAMVGACASGSTTFKNAGRLRLKESDRLAATADLLRTVGLEVEEGPETLTVFGGRVAGGAVDGYGDHRMVMSAAILAAVAGHDPLCIHGAEAVRKSFPHFFDDFAHIGGKCHVVSDRT